MWPRLAAHVVNSKPCGDVMKKFALFVVIISFAFLAAPKATGHQNANAQMIYSSNKAGHYELYRLDLTTDHIIRLTNGEYSSSLLAISPDYRWLVAREEIDQHQSRYYRMDIDGNQKAYLFENSDYQPYNLPVTDISGSSYWLNGEEYMLWNVRNKEKNVDLILYDLDSHNIHAVAVSEMHEHLVTTHPTENWIYFETSDENETTLYRVKPDQSQLQVVLTTAAPILQVNWASGGQWMFLVTENPDKTTDIFQISPEGSIRRKFTIGNERVLYPYPSPDMQWLIFRVNRGNENLLYKMNLSSKEAVQLPSRSQSNRFEAWVSDTEFLLSSNEGVVNHDIYKLNILNGNIECIVCNEGNNHFQGLTPDQDWVIFRRSVNSEPYSQLFRKSLDSGLVEQLTTGEGNHFFEGWYNFP